MHPLWTTEQHMDWWGVPPSIWFHVRRLLPRPPRRRRRKRDRVGGRPRSDDRKAFSAILWIARTGAYWRQLPRRLGSERTARRRLARWTSTGALEEMFASYILRTTEAEILAWADVFYARPPRAKLDWIELLEWTFRRLPRADRLAWDQGRPRAS